MQDYLPDVPEEESVEGKAEPDQNSTETEKLVEPERKQADVSRKRLIVLVVMIGGLFLVGIVITILESLGVGKNGGDKEVQQEFENRLLLTEKKPGQMEWLFYLDSNVNNQFDHQEKLFADVSVSLRRVGDEEPLQTQASDVNGRVLITDLQPGEYEVRLINYELDKKSEADFVFPKQYILSADGQFLPSQWQRLSLGVDGYQQIVGIREYRPNRVIVYDDGYELSFYDPDNEKFFGYSQFNDQVLRTFWLRDKHIYYLQDKMLKQLSFDYLTVSPMLEWLYDVGEKDYALSPLAGMVVYEQDGELTRQSKGNYCREGTVLIDGIRMELKPGLVDFWDENRLMFVGSLGEEPWAVYEGRCEDGELKVAVKLEEDVVSAGYLTEDTWFYSDSTGSYFYSLANGESVKYGALGAGVVLKTDSKKKYLWAELGNNYVIVDYPAVKASGVEKHYVVPAGDSLAISGDEGLVLNNQTIKRFKMMGNGVWEWVEEVMLPGAVKEVLGEVKL